MNPRMRYEILRRDAFRCRACGASPSEGGPELHVDHVTPVALGGTDDPANLQTLCQACNLGKGSTPPDAALVDEVEAHTDRWVQAVAMAAERMQEHPFQREVEEIAAVFDGWYELTPADIDAIRKQLAQGLPAEEVLEAANITRYSRHVSYKRAFAYFLGICRRKTADLHAIARQMMDEGQV